MVSSHPRRIGAIFILSAPLSRSFSLPVHSFLRSLYVFPVLHPDLVAFPLCTPSPSFVANNSCPPLWHLCMHFLTSRNAILLRPPSLTDGYSSPWRSRSRNLSFISSQIELPRDTFSLFFPSSCLPDRIPLGEGEWRCVSRKRKLHREGDDETARTTTRDRGWGRGDSFSRLRASSNR